MHATPPEPFILEHGGDWVVIQVLSAPHVHPSGGYAASQTQKGQEKPYHLARGGGHGFSCWVQASRSKPPPSCWEGSRASLGRALNQKLPSAQCLLILFSLDSSVSLLLQGHGFRLLGKQPQEALVWLSFAARVVGTWSRLSGRTHSLSPPPGPPGSASA